MEFIIDSADTAAIRRCIEFFPVAGVTTNPTIISKEKTDFKALIAEIRSIIGPDKLFFAQTVQTKAEKIVDTIKLFIDKQRALWYDADRKAVL